MTKSLAFHKVFCVSVVIVGVFLIAFMMVICAPALAQTTPVSPQKEPLEGPFGASQAFSRDGLLMAHFGPEYPAALYVKNLGSGEDKLILKGTDLHADWDVVSSLAFSPDGNRLLFEAGPPRMYTGAIYTAKTDGSNLVVLTSDAQRVRDSSDASGRTMHDIGIGNPIYSPDGSEVLVEVNVSNGRRDDQGRIDDSEDKNYIALLSATGAKQTPRMLMELNEGEAALFWSSDGTAIYYAGKDALIYRFNIESKEILPATNEGGLRILGRVPGADVVFVQRPPSDFITVKSLGGPEVSQSLKDLAASIPFRDSEGRYLRSIDGAGQHQLLVTYEASVTPRDVPREHSQLVNFP